jgi:hypothetical protein
LPEDQVLPVYKTTVLGSLKGALVALQEHRLGSIDENGQTGDSLCPNFELMPIRNEQYSHISPIKKVPKDSRLITNHIEYRCPVYGFPVLRLS